MNKRVFKFSHDSTLLVTSFSFRNLRQYTHPGYSILVTDQNVYDAHKKKFSGWNTIVLIPGEEYKVQATVDSIIEQLIEMGADRKTTLVGVGGGVITDITGFVASIYMRGIRFGFVPTTVLSMVDASVGGKNGVDVGYYKNLVGIIRQPAFILHDLSFLKTLPAREWQNGFAEIIKHACIADPALFHQLETNSLKGYTKNNKLLSGLISRNVNFKMKLVQRDEFEAGPRRMLNFGHTIGHALETQYDLMHGEAIAIGMVCDCNISEQLLGFTETGRITAVIEKYKLPSYANFNKEKVFAILKMDKKREQKAIHYILLKKIGKGVIKPIPLSQLHKLISQY